MSSDAHLKAREDELMRMNQELELKRQKLKQEYQDFKQESQMGSSQQQDYDNPYLDDQPDADDYYDHHNQGMLDQVVHNIRSEHPEQDHQQLLERKLQDVKKYDDNKSAEIQELEIITDEQDKIIRMQSAKLDALQSQLGQLQSQNHMNEQLVYEMESKGKNISDQSKRYHAQIDQLNEKLNQIKKKSQDAQAKTKVKEKENNGLVKEIDYLKKDFRKVDGEINKRDLKINRLQEEIANLKMENQKLKLNQQEKYGDLYANNENIQKENQRLEAQIIKLLNGIKKQLKLIDILKRQRVHLIGAKMFSFIEDEFIQTIEMGQQAQKN